MNLSIRSPITSVLEEVRAAAQAEHATVRRRIDLPRLDLHFIAGAGAEQHLALGLDPSVVLPEHLPTSRFVEMHDSTIPGLGRRGLLLTLIARHYADLFLVVCSDLVDRLTRCDSVRAPGEFLVVVQRWQRFFERSAEGLSAECQRGLFSELTFLRHLLAGGAAPPRACEWWVGPLGERQDFWHNAAAVEVKSVASNRPLLAHIASERQLDMQGQLFLVCFLLDAGTIGTTLPSLVASARKAFRDDPAASAMFEERLVSAGYSDTHADKYTTSYIVRDVLPYRVESDFPRIVEAGLRHGVSNVRYAIDLDVCRPHAVGLDVVTSVFQKGEA